MADDFGDRCLDALRPVLSAPDDELGEHPAYRGLPVMFVGAVEMIGDDGEPYIIILKSPGDTAIWRALGLVEYVAAEIRSKVGSSDGGG